MEKCVGSADMPFYYVQIAPYKYENSRNTGAALLREAQVEALKTIPNSGIVPTTDIGDEFCIHPPQKDVVGLRLATLALTKTYGIRRLPSNGPMMTKVDYADKKAIVTFDNAPAGLFPTSPNWKDLRLRERTRSSIRRKQRL